MAWGVLEKRPIRLGFAAVLAVLLVGWVAFKLVSPQYRPGLRDGERYGVDVSRHQGQIDWNLVAGDGIEFAYLKSTEGGDWVDPKFEDNWRAASAAGLEVGAYHFFRTCTDGATQARNVLDTVPDEPHALPIAIDVESGGVCEEVTTPEVITREFREFVDLVTAERGPLVYYVLPGFEYLIEDGEPRDLWRRFLWVRPRDEWAIWQASWFVRVDGIDTPVDLNVMAQLPESRPR